MKKSVIAFCIALVIALWLGLAALLQYERTSIIVYAGFMGVMSVLILGFAALVTFQISRQARAGDNLRASEQRLHEIIELMPVGLFIKDPASRIVLMNRACEAQWGMAFADLRDTDGSQFFPPAQMEGFLAADRDAFAGRRALDFEEVSWNAALQENRNVRTLKKPVFDAAGDPAYLIGMTVDITEHKNAETALRRSEARLKEAQALVHIGSWELDLVSNTLHWCDEIYRIFEIDPQCFGASYEAFLAAVHPEERAQVDQAYTNSVASKIPYSIEHRLLMAHGRIKWVWEQCSTHYDNEGKPLRSIGTVQDITKRAMEEKALQESQSLLANIIGSAMDAIITVDETYRILVFNRAAEAMFRCAAADAIGQPLDRFIPERFRDRHHAQMRAYGESGVTTRAMGQPGTVIGLRADGGEFPVEATIAHAKADGRHLFTVMLRDIVGRIAAAESQRDALVREVHHRIKNNLQGVIGLMRQHLTAHPELEGLVERMISQIRAIAVIHGMHSELTQGEIGLCELVTGISQATTVLTQIEIAAEGLEDTPGSIRIPRDEAVPIALVLNELLFNASKHGLNHTGGGGIRVRVSEHDGLARVRISNPGALPAPDFDFAKGTGLGTGLNLVKALLPRHGARLEIIQEDDQVVVELALTDPAIIYSS